MSQCFITPLARRDLSDIWLFIAEDSVVHADRLVDRLLAESNLIADHPRMGVERADLAPDIRGFPVDRQYLILYRVIDDGIEVPHVVHDARYLRKLGFDR